MSTLKSYLIPFALIYYYTLYFRFSVPVAFYLMQSASNLLLVVNSSINFIIYCCVGKRFRAKLKVALAPICQKLYLSR